MMYMIDRTIELFPDLSQSQKPKIQVVITKLKPTRKQRKTPVVAPPYTNILRKQQIGNNKQEAEEKQEKWHI